MSNSIDKNLKVHLASRSPFLFLVSYEEDRILRHLKKLAGKYYKKLITWTITNGLMVDDVSLGEKYKTPIAALEYIQANEEQTLFILQDFHPNLEDTKVIRKFRDLISFLQTSASAIILISPKLTIPDELEKDMIVMDYPLPGIEDIENLYKIIEKGVAQNPRYEIDLKGDEHEQLLNALLGLTENEAKNVLAKALVSDSTLDISDLEVILSEKEQIIRKSGMLECYSSPERLSTIGGLDELKAWLISRKAAFSVQAREFKLPYPKGLLVIGVPGCGKSLIAKAIAKEWGQPLLKLDVGRLFGSFVGSSEENIRKSIQVAEAVAPAILWIDEIEKGFAGIKSQADSGTSARVFSTFLTWMQEKSSAVFVIATANDISALPPEMLRKGRFDEIFFVDLPLEDERELILDIHLKKRQRDPKTYNIDIRLLAKASSEYSGAELEQAIIASLFKAFSEEKEISTEIILSCIKETYPLAKTMSEPVQEMREWSKNRARYASNKFRDTQGKLHSVKHWSNLGSVEEL